MSKTVILDLTDFRKWQVKFNKAIADRMLNIGIALSTWGDLVVSRAQTFYLTGAALNVKSGKLRSSIRKEPSTGVKKSGDVYYVEVGTRVWYGKFWEIGGTYTAMVSAHQRRITKVFGQPIHSPVIANIRAHTRHVSEEARPWLEPSINDTISQGERLLRKAGVVFR